MAKKKVPIDETVLIQSILDDQKKFSRLLEYAKERDGRIADVEIAKRELSICEKKIKEEFQLDKNILDSVLTYAAAIIGDQEESFVEVDKKIINARETMGKAIADVAKEDKSVKRILINKI